MRMTMNRPALLLLLAVAVGAPAAARADFVLIGNADGAPGHLYKSEVKEVFTGKRRQWAGYSAANRRGRNRP